MGFLPARLRNSKAYSAFQKFLRVLQFLSAVISLGLFSARLYKILRLTKQASTSNGAVEGILAAAVAYTLAAMLLTFCLKNGGPKFLRWIMVLLDVLFVGAFIAVAYETRPSGGPSGPCRKTRLQPTLPKSVNCNLPWGTFILGIISTILHALTAIFHEARDKYYNRHHDADTNGVGEKHHNHDHEAGTNGTGNLGNGHHNGHQGTGDLGNGHVNGHNVGHDNARY